MKATILFHRFGMACARLPVQAPRAPTSQNFRCGLAKRPLAISAEIPSKQSEL
jgi:hypothetical protein